MVAAAILLALLGQLFAHATPARNNDKEEKLTAQIEDQKNPGKKARLQVRLAKLKLKEADKAYRSRNFDEGKTLLRQYLEQIRNSWTTLQGADNGVRKHLGAFKDLEITLREDDRFLEDLRHRVPYPESEFVKEIAKKSSEVHNQVLEALFPSGFTPKGRKKLSPPKSRMPAKVETVKS